ncbi:hypothetical protein KUH32_11090 [Thalassococcus sp. CAU 1522]|uniref:Transcriptional activator HlyU n=1 Tax=Thalassococcus arenae TaxID=2851652 RepID=A0ABS6N8H2_9RHOB|nr:HlyU family transcriptional regulator [Thalassococcus arenae]MBV2360323.1 hypothetical protein [Thalassococcus arenae]
MSLLSRLFGGGGGAAKQPVAAPVDHAGFRITPDPIPVDGQFRLAAWIEAEIDGEAKRHHMIRADLVRDRDEAVTATLAKARQMIDQLGPRLFDGPDRR